MLVFDEVQTGFGRTARWFAADHFDVDPDIIAMGKGIANGLPLSAYGAAAEVIDGWPVGAHGTTFGGNPVACAAAGAVIGEMGGLLEDAQQVSDRAFERFTKLAEASPVVGDVRGLGLMIGVELVEDPETRDPDRSAMRHVTRHALANELILIACGPDGNVIRFIPPLVATMDEVDWAIDLVEEAVNDYVRRMYHHPHTWEGHPRGGLPKPARGRKHPRQGQAGNNSFLATRGVL